MSDAVDPQTYSALGRQAADTADRIKALAELMETASFHADGLPPAQLREIANTLHGAAIRAAMAADDVGLLGELTARTWTPLHRNEGVDRRGRPRLAGGGAPR